MLLKINCSSNVFLKNLKEVKELLASVLDYKLKDDNLTGNVLISGKYLSKVDNLIYFFNDCIPFSVMFSDKFVEVKKIECEDIKYKLLEDEKIEVSFKLSIDYNDNQTNDEETILDLQTEIDMKTNILLDENFERIEESEQYDIFNIDDTYKDIIVEFK